MASVNIAIKKDAYQFLRSLKDKNKSFSDVILGFKQKEGNILRFFGVLKDVNWADRKKEMASLRESFEKRL